MINKININIKKLNKNAIITKYATEFAAGSDLYACLEEDIIIKPNESKKITTGLAMEIPTGFVGLVYARSGLATKFDIAPSNKVGVIDSDYRGEICVFLKNNGKNDFKVSHGDRIAQIVITPYFTANFIEVDELSETIRGEKGFGSTGTN